MRFCVYRVLTSEAKVTYINQLVYSIVGRTENIMNLHLLGKNICQFLIFVV